jgi:hypothetical protein
MYNVWLKRFRRLRNITKWLIIPMLIGLYFVEEYMDSKYAVGPFPLNMPSPPRPPWWLMNLRNYGFLGTLFITLFSLPKWQSLLGLAGLIIFLRLYGSI